ncbi:hypothetical protein FMEAI12_4660024 [Parafrankia sp. Ea1.12]|nr:hypothetical protein FMEAI12_4660024 [Parafrankia sp. Ea1.12]
MFSPREPGRPHVACVMGGDISHMWAERGAIAAVGALPELLLVVQLLGRTVRDGRRAWGHGHRGDRAAAPQHDVHHAQQLRDVEQRAGHVAALRPDLVHLRGVLPVPAGDELGRRVTLAAGAVPDDDAGEANGRVLTAHRVDELVERGLAHVVGREPRPGRRQRRAHRRQVGRHATRGLQVGESRGGDQRRADHVRVERLAPGGGADRLEPGERADAGGVDDGVDPAQTRRRLLDRGLAGLLVGHVAGDGERARPGLLGRLDQPVLPAGEQCHLVAALAPVDADTPAEAARRTDHHNSHRLDSSSVGRGPRHAGPVGTHVVVGGPMSSCRAADRPHK